jgi:DNA-binding helix-hairpin-helix protein with protein kinase domain
MTPEIVQTAVPAPAEPVTLAIEPSDYATGFVEGFLRAHGVTSRPDMLQFRAALAELTEHLAEARRWSN